MWAYIFSNILNFEFFCKIHTLRYRLHKYRKTRTMRRRLKICHDTIDIVIAANPCNIVQ